MLTSPQDDHIDRDAFFERCFPTIHRYHHYTLLHAVDVDEHHVVSVYEYALADGTGTFRNAELHAVRGQQVHEAQVFFGGRRLTGARGGRRSARSVAEEQGEAGDR